MCRKSASSQGNHSFKNIPVLKIINDVTTVFGRPNRRGPERMILNVSLWWKYREWVIAPKDILRRRSLSNTSDGVVFKLMLFTFRKDKTCGVCDVHAMALRQGFPSTPEHQQLCKRNKEKASTLTTREINLPWVKGKAAGGVRWRLWGISLESSSAPDSRHFTACTEAPHNPTAKPQAALRKLSIPSQFQGDPRMSWRHCTLKILGRSHRTLATNISHGKLTWEFPDYICHLIWLMCYHVLALHWHAVYSTCFFPKSFFCVNEV